jgi:predicted dehydrogenase
MRHLSVGHAEPLRAELSAFVTAIREGLVPPVTGEEGVASLEIAMQCLASRPEIPVAIERRRVRRVAG